MNGHVRLCQCKPCVAARYEMFLESISAFTREEGVLPSNPDQTVMVRRYSVRPHFRRNPRHLTADAGLRRQVHAYFEKLTKRGK